MASEIFQRLLKEVKPENRKFVEKNLAISYQVRNILNIHPTIKTQKDLAKALGKESSEVSRWLSGMHNIGLENITKMEMALGQDIILTVEEAKKRFVQPMGKKYRILGTITSSERRVRINRQLNGTGVGAIPVCKNSLSKHG